jgi:hypothetical protein
VFSPSSFWKVKGDIVCVEKFLIRNGMCLKNVTLYRHMLECDNEVCCGNRLALEIASIKTGIANVICLILTTGTFKTSASQELYVTFKSKGSDN